MEFKYTYILALGSNLNDREKNVLSGAEALKSYGIRIISETSNLYTRAEIVRDQPDFLNKGLLVQTDLEPEILIATIKKIETALGRETNVRYGPRKIDIDIVWWSKGKYQSKDLQIPHQWNNARSWVREIIAELIPNEYNINGKYHTMNVKNIKTTNDFKLKKEAGEKIVMLTAYDYSTGRILSRTSVDVLLVGDSLGNVILGYESTLRVTVEDMIHHGAAVKRGAPEKFIIIDMPFLSYHASKNEAVKNAGKIIARTGAEAVKLEGGKEFTGVIKKIIRAGIPVMGHIGLMPQSVLKIGGYKTQGKTDEDQKRIIEEALALQDAGVFGIVAEMIPPELGEKLAKAVEIPVIGIGAGRDTDGQVLVINDMLGLNEGHVPKFVKTYMNGNDAIMNAVEQYSEEIRKKVFPEPR